MSLRRTSRPLSSLALVLLVGAAACSPGTTEAAGRDGEVRERGGVTSASAGVPDADDPTTTSTATTTTAPATTSTTTTLPPGPPPLPTEVGDLQSGSDGVRTQAVQEALDRLGFDPGEADGAFGPKTTMAVWAFQALTGRPKDGIVTAELEQAILTADPIPMLRPDLGPTHTEVDLDKQVLLVWGDGVLELATHVSSGSGVAYCERGHCGDAVTPLGDYRYQRRIAGPRHAPLGVLHDPVYFNGGIAVHGAGSVPNHPASHGCVRIPMHISSSFQSLVADGEPIAVFRGGAGPAGPVPPPGTPAAPPPAGAENGG